VKLFVEWPLFEIGRRIRESLVLEGEIVLVVDEGANLLRRPFDRIHVESGARGWDFQCRSLLSVDGVVIRCGVN